MRSKRLHGSPQALSEKPGKRRCVDGSTFSNTSGVTSPPASETDDQDFPPDNEAQPQTGLHSAAHPDDPEQSIILYDQADHGNQDATEHGNSQSLTMIQRPSMCDQQDALSSTTSAPLNVRAVGGILTDWPSYSAGLTTGICDLKTLKLIIASDDLSDDHKAMWVSLVQTIVYEPDQRSVLLFLQNLLSGDLTTSDNLVNHPEVTRVSNITYHQWAVTGSISKYAGEKRKWSAAHVVDLALWVDGPDAGMQAARALKIFGVWGPSGVFIMSYRQHSIKTCLEPETILRKIWPSAIGSEDIVAWANLHQPSTHSPFETFEDAHMYLLRQCIGADLTLFARLSRGPATAGDASNRMISRTYFDSTLAPLLKEYFDADVDLELAYSAAVESQGRSTDRDPVKPNGLPNVPRRPRVLPKKPVRPRNAGYHQEYEYEDDEETFLERERSSLTLRINSLHPKFSNT